MPWNSRYVGTLNYTMMRQNDVVHPDVDPGPTFPLPASSLNGAINTLLSNNVVTTKITPDLTSKSTYRYYDFDNNTPELCCSPGSQVGSATIKQPRRAKRRDLAACRWLYSSRTPVKSLNWRPTKEWNLGAAYGYERYDWTQADVNYTNENSGKVYADWKPMSWVLCAPVALFRSALRDL